MVKLKDASTPAAAASNRQSDRQSRIQGWRCEVVIKTEPSRRYMERIETETRQKRLKEEYMQWCDLVRVTKKARWHSSAMIKLTQRFITYKLHHSRRKDENGVETCMSWTELKTLARDLRNIVEVEVDTSYIDESEIILFDLSLKWHIHRICKQLPVPRDPKPFGSEKKKTSRVDQQHEKADDGYDSWEESPSAEDLRVDWAAFVEEEKEEEEIERKDYKIEAEGDVEVKVKQADGRGRRGSGLRNVLVAEALEDFEEEDSLGMPPTIEVSLGDVVDSPGQPPAFADKQTDKAAIDHFTQEQPQQMPSCAGESSESKEPDDFIHTTDNQTHLVATSDTIDHHLTNPTEGVTSPLPTQPAITPPSPPKSPPTTLILTTPDATLTPTHTRPLDEPHDRPPSFGMESMSAKRRKIF